MKQNLLAIYTRNKTRQSTATSGWIHSCTTEDLIADMVGLNVDFHNNKQPLVDFDIFIDGVPIIIHQSPGYDVTIGTDLEGAAIPTHIVELAEYIISAEKVRTRAATQ